MRSMKHHTLGMAAVRMYLMILSVCIINGRGQTIAKGSEVRLTDDEQFLKNEFAKINYRWDQKMRGMYGKCFVTLTDEGLWGGRHVVGLPSPDGSQNGIWYFPPSVLSKCETPSPTEKPTPSPTAKPTAAPTPSPTDKPTAAPTCIEKQIWTEEVAKNNCAAKHKLRKFDKVKACDSNLQGRLEMSVANQLYKKCKSECVYDYDTILTDDKAAFRYRKRKKCYKLFTKGACLRKKRFAKVVERAKLLC